MTTKFVHYLSKVKGSNEITVSDHLINVLSLILQVAAYEDEYFTVLSKKVLDENGTINDTLVNLELLGFAIEKEDTDFVINWDSDHFESVTPDTVAGFVESVSAVKSIDARTLFKGEDQLIDDEDDFTVDLFNNLATLILEKATSNDYETHVTFNYDTKDFLSNAYNALKLSNMGLFVDGLKATFFIDDNKTDAFTPDEDSNVTFTPSDDVIHFEPSDEEEVVFTPEEVDNCQCEDCKK